VELHQGEAATGFRTFRQKGHQASHIGEGGLDINGTREGRWQQLFSKVHHSSPYFIEVVARAESAAAFDLTRTPKASTSWAKHSLAASSANFEDEMNKLPAAPGKSCQPPM
jgi:hypothetical protein